MFSSLPSVGQVIDPGQSLYALSGKPVVLLPGATPAWRTLSVGETGTDVAELNAALVRLGYATSSEVDGDPDYFGATTADAVKALQYAIGAPQTGSLTLGYAVFLPTPARVTKVNATLGAAAHPGAPVFDASSTTRQVIASVPASKRSQIAVGDPAVITLPDGRTTPGRVAWVGTTATGSPTSLRVGITATDPAVTGGLDEAPVQVSVTTAKVASVLTVPVAALTTTRGGHPALEVVGAKGAAHLVPVSVGLVDDNAGLVRVSGPGLAAGQRVVLPPEQRAP